MKGKLIIRPHHVPATTTHRLTMPELEDRARDDKWCEAHDWRMTYWHDGTRTIDFPNGRIRIPQYPKR